MPNSASAASVASVATPSELNAVVDRSFPVSALPPIMRNMVEMVADSLRVPDALPACCALAAVSAAIGSGLRIRTGGNRTLRGNIYIAAGVASGSGKSEVFKTILEPVFEQQRWLDVQGKQTQSRKQVDRMLLDDSIRKLKAELIRENDLGNAAPGLKKKLATLLDRKAALTVAARQIVCDDATGAALEKLLSRNPMFSASDEAGDAILGNLMGRFSRGTEEGIYLRAYSGGYHGGVNRIGRDSVKLTDPCLTVLWLMQPRKLNTLFCQQSFREDGLLARILACQIETRPQKIDLQQPAETMSKDVLVDWQKLWLDLHESYHPIYHLKSNKPPVLLPSEIGPTLMANHFNETIDRRMLSLADMDSFAARWTEQAWRLAVVLHAASHGKRAHSKEVRCIESAIEIADWFSAQQIALLAQTRAEESENHEKRVLELLRSQLAKSESKDWINARDPVMARIVSTSLGAQQLLQKMVADGRLTSESHRPLRGGHTETRYREKK